MAGRRVAPPRNVTVASLADTGDPGTDRVMIQAEQNLQDLQDKARAAAATTSQVATLAPVVNSVFNVLQYGAVGDGVADDSAAINAALRAAGATARGVFGGFVYLPKGTYLCGSQIVIPNGVGMRGEGPGTIIKASDSFTAASLIRNDKQDGTQEYAFLESLQVNGNGKCSAAVVDFVSLFINSYVRDVVITGGANVGLHLAASNGMGPFLVENVWVLNNAGHNVLVEELAGNGNAMTGLVFVNLTSEHQGSNRSAVYCLGLGNASQWAFVNLHIEQGGAQVGRTGLTLDGVGHILVDGLQMFAGTPVNETAGVAITAAIQNVGIQIRGVYNPNLVNPILADAKNSVTIGAVNVPYYVTADVTFQGAPRFLPAAGGLSVAFQNSLGTDKVWLDATGALTGSSPTGAALDIFADATNNRAIALQDHAKARAFGWYFPDASSFRLRYFTGGLEIMNVDNSANVLFYQGMTLNALGGITTLTTAVKGSGARAAAPSTGTHAAGEVVFNADPVSGGFVGWVCVTGGSPGTWKSFGVIS